MNKKKIREINEIFRDFILDSKYEISTEGQDSILKKIENTKNVNFHSDWNYLMVLVLIIEKKYNVQSIVTSDNYVRFEMSDDYNFQDKGINKMEAIYFVCLRLLKELWKEGNISVSNNLVEPFDVVDLE